MTLERAKEIAEKVVSQLSPYCERIEIAGSVRREKPFPKDVEIVCIPRGKDYANFKRVIDGWTKIRGEATGKNTQRKGEDQ